MQHSVSFEHVPCAILSWKHGSRFRKSDNPCCATRAQHGHSTWSKHAQRHNIERPSADPMARTSELLCMQAIIQNWPGSPRSSKGWPAVPGQGYDGYELPNSEYGRQTTSLCCFGGDLPVVHGFQLKHRPETLRRFAQGRWWQRVAQILTQEVEFGVPVFGPSGCGFRPRAYLP